ncbi:eukaryotic-like serine/threonine-protein kinase [Enterococcus sp. AZ103]|uniref:PASTA domain-containing protein n=1 Tax=Enterococcus alishanensis TaxID=1303817 RepID=A0ABS6T8M8_9ENTE|nr:PASTA domain-containing protein [Enterococcus alishanensis]MBV7389254.1 PASTA domain-containing protein [Enterococcus alishanensis]
MSDFLSNFNGPNYKKSEEQSKEIEEKKVPEKKDNKRSKNEITEIDDTYQDKQKRKKRRIIVAALLAVIGCFVIYYQMSHVKMPDFTDKSLSDARLWATKNKLKVSTKQEFSLKKEANVVMSQSNQAGRRVKKGTTIRLNISKGPNPNQQLELPDFSKLSKPLAEKWIEENKATNLSLIEEYSDTAEKGKFLKFEIANSDVSEKKYRRKDAAKVFYSKGKETYKKDISVPNFVRQTRNEVETWAKNNEINMTYEETTSNDLPVDSVISQSLAKDEKIAKKDEMTVVVSLGKGYVIPNFSDFSMEDAANAIDGVQVQARGIYTDNLPYGQLVSQSVPAGTVLNAKNDLRVEAVYSLGQPYLKDLRGSYVEGDLQKYFYDEFNSKGVNINYTIRQVDSDQPKGTVVGMSVHNIFLPLNYTVSIDISLGNLGSASTSIPNNQKEQPTED